MLAVCRLFKTYNGKHIMVFFITLIRLYSQWMSLFFSVFILQFNSFPSIAKCFFFHLQPPTQTCVLRCVSFTMQSSRYYLCCVFAMCSSLYGFCHVMYSLWCFLLLCSLYDFCCVVLGVFSLLFFSRGHATLHLTVSVGT